MEGNWKKEKKMMVGNNKKIKVRKMEDQEDYEKSGFKGMMDDVKIPRKNH